MQIFKFSVIFSDNSVSESLKLFICEIVVWMLLTYCNFKFSDSSNFIVISARSRLFTSLLKSKSGSRIEEGRDAFFFIAIFRNWGIRVIIRIFENFVFL